MGDSVKKLYNVPKRSSKPICRSPPSRSMHEKRYAAVLDNAIARTAREQANTTTATDEKQPTQPERWLLTQRDRAVEMTMLNQNNHVYVRRAGMIPVVHGRAPNADLGLPPFPEFVNYT